MIVVGQVRYRYRIAPDEAQRGMLSRTFGCALVVFDDALRCRDEAWKAGEKVSNTGVQRRVISDAKGTEQRGWLAEVAGVPLVRSVADTMPLQARTWACGCGAVHDRDYDAARNILAAGRAERRNACGAPVSPLSVEVQREEAGIVLIRHRPH